MFIRHSVYGVDLISTDQMAFYYGALLPEMSSITHLYITKMNTYTYITLRGDSGCAQSIRSRKKGVSRAVTWGESSSLNNVPSSSSCNIQLLLQLLQLSAS